MTGPADFHPALGGKTLSEWLDDGIPPLTPEGPRHARRGHARPGWLRSLFVRCWQAQRDVKARLHAWNLAETGRRTTAERIAEMPSPWLAAPLAPLPEVAHGEPLDVRSDEEMADDWVGDLGPAELAEAKPAPERDTAYPDWATGQFAIMDAEIGAGAQ